MIRKLGACLMAFVVAASFVPSKAEAASNNATNKKIAKFFAKLKKIPNRGAPPVPTAKVKRFTLKLVKLDPKKANKYYKQATRKYAYPVLAAEAKKLAKKVTKQVGKSKDLTAQQIKKISKQVSTSEKKAENQAHQNNYAA